MTARQETIRKQIEDGREAKERLEAAEAEYKEALAETRRRAARIREEAAAEGRRSSRSCGPARPGGGRPRSPCASEARLEAERQQIVAQLRSEVGQLAVDLAEQDRR